MKEVRGGSAVKGYEKGWPRRSSWVYRSSFTVNESVYSKALRAKAAREAKGYFHAALGFNFPTEKAGRGLQPPREGLDRVRAP